MSTEARSDLEDLIQREILVSRSKPVGKGDVRGRDCSTAVQIALSSQKNRALIRRVLGDAGLKIWDDEPHLRFNLIMNIPIPLITISSNVGDSFLRLQLDAATSPYSRSDSSEACKYTSVHIGQRKLLINEVLFMTKHGSKAKTVVYIGAAGGSHTPALCELYPNHRFLLYDPAHFSKPLLDYMRRNPKRVAVYNELFPPADKTGRAARDLAEATGPDSGGFLLISDIRRRDVTSEAPTNKDVDEDMVLQSDICREMIPLAAHLKCRLPYMDPESTEQDIPVVMPKGDIYFQPWCAHKSTETRLFLVPPYDDDHMMTVSARWYESALYHHNMNNRYSRYEVADLAPLAMFVGPVYDSCFDCTFERFTIMQYLATALEMVGSGPNSDVSQYTSFASVYNLFKRHVGREDERMLREETPPPPTYRR